MGFDFYGDGTMKNGPGGASRRQRALRDPSGSGCGFGFRRAIVATGAAGLPAAPVALTSDLAPKHERAYLDNLTHPIRRAKSDAELLKPLAHRLRRPSRPS
jgi:hypothetical protein